MKVILFFILSCACISIVYGQALAGDSLQTVSLAISGIESPAMNNAAEPALKSAANPVLQSSTAKPESADHKAANPDISNVIGLGVSLLVFFLLFIPAL